MQDREKKKQSGLRREVSGVCRKGGAYDILLTIEVSEKVHCDFYYYQVLLSVWITYKQLVHCRKLQFDYMLINCKSASLVLRRIIELSRTIT